MAVQTDDKKLDGAGLRTLWGIIKSSVPPAATAGKYLHANASTGALEWVDVEGGASYTPTLLSAPTSSTTTYTKDGNTYDFSIGQFCRVADASMDAGYKFYQLYDLHSNGTVAVWQEFGTPLERTALSVTSNNPSLLTSLRSSAVITVTDENDNEVFSGTLPQTRTLKLTPGISYTVSAAPVTGYATPQSQTFEAEYEGIRSIDMEYATTVLTVTLSSDTGEADLSNVTITVTDTTASSAISAQQDGTYLIPIGHEYSVAVSDDVEGYNAPATATGTASGASHTASFEYVAIVDGEVTVVPTARELTYTGSSQELVTAGEGTGMMMYKLGDGDWSSVIPSAINAGTYTVKYKASASHGYYESDEGTVIVTIAKAAQVYTAPQERSLTYSGSSQYLITSGSVTYGTFYYSADGSSWSQTRPSQTNAGTYTSYWKITGDSNHEDVAITSVSTTIQKATPTYTAPSNTGYTYNGSSRYLLTSGSTSHGTIYYSSDGTNWSTTRPSATNAGTYYRYWKLDGDSNHTNISSKSVTCYIYQASASFSTTPSARSVTYTGSNQYLVTTGYATGTVKYKYRYKSYNSSSWGSWSSYSTSRPYVTNAGYYEVRYMCEASSDGNYAASNDPYNTISVEMYRKSRTISFTTNPLTVKVGSSVTVDASPSAGSGDGTISYSSGSTSVATVSGRTVTGVAYGTAVITATISAGTNYASASTTYTIKVYTGGVDMGLPSGILWADCNVGASTPYAYECKFFSWGNTDGHAPTSSTSFGSYSWGTSNNTEPYVSSAGAALTGNIPLSQDAARANLGSPWRMPTSSEFAELFNNIDYVQADGTTVISTSTTNKLVTVNGVTGIYLKSKVNGNLLFFPCSGYGYGQSWYGRGEGYFWSSSLYSATHGRCFTFNSGGVIPQDYFNRILGFAVRPVQ